jgi:NADPH2:quinone reductase
MNHAIRIHETGDPEVMRWEETALADLAPNEARVRHEAVGLNFIDIYFRSGRYPLQPPSGLGLEGAGVVEAVGSAVTEVKVGDRVAYAGGPLGAYAEARNIPADRLVVLPDAIDFRTAAAMMLQGMTAQYLPRAAGRHDPDPGRRRRRRPDRLPVGEGARRDGDRHGELGREGRARPGAWLRPSDHLYARGLRRPGPRNHRRRGRAGGV